MTYGRDTWCYDRIQTGRMATGAELVAQAIFRRLNTARGTLRDGEEGLVYGLDLLDFVGTVGTEAAIAALPDVVRAEVMKDDRVAQCEVTAASTSDAAGLVTIVLDIDCVLEDSNQTFALSIGVNDVSASLIGVTT